MTAIPGVGAAAPPVRVQQPMPAERVVDAGAQRAQGAILDDAYARLGIDGTKLHDAPAVVDPATLDASARQAAMARATDPRRVVHIPVGSTVALGQHGEQQWTVLGAASGDRLELGRRTESGAIQRTIRPWSQVIERNAQLPVDYDGSMLEGFTQSRGDVDAVSALGRQAPVHFQEAAARTSTSEPFAFTSTWDDVLRGAELARRHPVVVRPDMDGAIGLRQLLGDTRVVVSGVQQGWREAADANPWLIATETMPAGAQKELDGLVSTQRWFHDVAGIDVWKAGQPVGLMTDLPDFVANASAGLSQEGTGEVAVVYQGPRSEPLRQAVLHKGSGRLGQLTRRSSEYVGNAYPAVTTHEAGHIATARHWGRLHTFVAPTMEAELEAGVVDEAMADLFAAARTGEPRIGQVRSLTKLTHEYGSLDAFHGTMQLRGSDFDVHAGTQLLTRPMMRVMQDHGKDMLGEVTGAAVHRLGQQLGAGELAAVDLPSAATALRTAAAWRLGDLSPTVRYLDEAWKALKVLR